MPLISKFFNLAVSTLTNILQVFGIITLSPSTGTPDNPISLHILGLSHHFTFSSYSTTSSSSSTTTQVSRQIIPLIQNVYGFKYGSLLPSI